MDSAIIKTLPAIIQQFNITGYSKVALITLFTADFLHTLPDEINFLWPSSWTLVKIVFFICRYSPFVDAIVAIIGIASLNPPTNVCTQIVRITIWSGGIGQISAHVILIIRVYALLGRSRLTAFLLSFFGVGVFAAALTFITSVERQYTVIRSPLPGFIPGCLMTSSSAASATLSIAGIIVSVAAETLLFPIVCWARFLKYKEERNLLARKLYNDALIYYLISFAVSTSGIIVWFASTGPIRDLSSRVPRFLLNIVACRIILQIRKYGQEGRQSADTDNAFTALIDETHPPVSRLQFRVTVQSNDTDLPHRDHV